MTTKYYDIRLERGEQVCTFYCLSASSKQEAVATARASAVTQLGGGTDEWCVKRSREVFDAVADCD